MRLEVDDSLLFWAFRYALGRSTYAVFDVANELIRLAPEMKQRDRDLILREIREAAEYGRIGMRMDHEAWMRVREAMLEASP